MKFIAGCVRAVLAAVLLAPASAQAQENADTLSPLVEVLSQTDDPQFQLDILKGISEALKGRRQVAMPQRWEQVETKLSQSANPEVRTVAQALALTFGSNRALSALRSLLVDASAELPARRMALDSLFDAKDSGLAPLLQQLLNDADLRAAALRSLAAYDDPKTPTAILAVYRTLNAGEKRDALNTLASRVTFAQPLVSAVGAGVVSSKDLSADVIRQLRNLKHATIDEEIRKVWGVARDSTADKQQEIAKYRATYRAGGSQPGDAIRGRVVFARTCQQCHTLFEEGGKVGPDLTGSNRADLEYILQNMVDPNAVIPNDYRSSTLETKDDRIITGIVSKQDDKSVTVLTANETLVLPRNEIKSLQQSDISMMPEGLLANLADQEIRDLIYYLSRPAQVPLPVK
jgi:putative heme-binding domain-containing protein